MILGLSIDNFVILHVAISLIAIVAGFVVIFAMLGGRRSGLTTIFLLMTLLTSVTGFMFPITAFTPALGTGVVAMLVLLPTLLALYAFGLVGAWRWVYAVGAVISLYLNVFVLVVQSFQKLSVLQPLAPTQSEPPFLIAQAAVLGLFLVLGFLAVKKFHPAPAMAVPA